MSNRPIPIEPIPADYTTIIIKFGSATLRAAFPPEAVKDIASKTPYSDEEDEAARRSIIDDMTSNRHIDDEPAGLRFLHYALRLAFSSEMRPVLLRALDQGGLEIQWLAKNSYVWLLGACHADGATLSEVLS